VTNTQILGYPQNLASVKHPNVLCRSGSCEEKRFVTLTPTGIRATQSSLKPNERRYDTQQNGLIAEHFVSPSASKILFR